MTVLEQQLVDKIKELRRQIWYWRERYEAELEKRRAAEVAAEQRAEESENKVTQ